MAKLTYTDKKEIIRIYDDERYEYSRTASLFHVSPSLIERVVRNYHLHIESKTALAIEIKHRIHRYTFGLKNIKNLAIMVLSTNRKEDRQS